MHAQANTLALVLLFVFILVSALVLYAFITKIIEVRHVSTHDLPVLPVALGSSARYVDTNTVRVCVYVLNVWDQNLEIPEVLMVSDHSLVEASSGVNILGPGGTGVICAHVDEKSYGGTLSVVLPAGTISVPAPRPSPLQDSAFRAVLSYTPSGNPIDPRGNEVNVVIANGDFNDVYAILLSRINGEVRIRISGSCVETNTVTTVVSTGRNSVRVSETNALPGTSCVVTLDLNGKKYAFDTVVWRARDCYSKTSCEYELNEANKSLPTPTVLMLAADVDSNIVFPEYVDFNWSLIFDGNGHDVNNGTNGMALYLSWDRNLYLAHLNLYAGYDAFYCSNSVVTFTEGNIGVVYDYGACCGICTCIFDKLRLRSPRIGILADVSDITILNSDVNGGAEQALRLKGNNTTPARAILENSVVYAEDNAVSVSNVEINVDLSSGNVVITSPGFDWRMDGDLNVFCQDCTNGYVLDTNFEDRVGSGTLTYHCSGNVQAYTCP